MPTAQMRKMRNIIRQLRIQPGDRVLEIGTGWGALAILMAQTVDCTIDTITLSTEQAELATRRVADAGLADRVKVHYMDFRECRNKPDWAGAFDKFFSIEMIDNLSKDFIAEFWSVVDWALKPRTAIGVVQVISMPEARIPAYDKARADFIQKWVSATQSMTSLWLYTHLTIDLCFLLETMNSGTQGRLTVDSVHNIGPHYARTLREWKRKFLSNWPGLIAKELAVQYELDDAELEIFKRKWIYYFDYCEAGFATRSLGDHVITFTREGYADFGCDFDSHF
ncbi:S-adenosyl-L-methionine-dependent methyltransferase [Rhodofomes roseus]|uniref:S-adenosyl-L-methionine-dependent methyltransferase n=1 Tax=Rhodofomes roseus TaxID=34475 RepID=A0ABQ8KRH3_9APHY|nr:S-adenosyl-L-methionine-dependent methyltransferase [Rhodofomes roseus]KAH9841018.1 S-adenosyl-L-methionine-dependent methyltransferase [Rhodofomes roseus]